MKSERLELWLMAGLSALVLGTVIVMSAIYGIHETGSFTF